MQFIDLSQPLRDRMPAYPGDPDISIRPALTVAADGVAVARLDFGSHSGTHLDAPAHVILGGRTVDLLPLELLIGSATVLRVPGALAGSRIEVSSIPAGIPDQLPQIVCVQTGWDRHFGSDEMLRHPSLALELAELLWGRGARVLCVDTLSPDPTDTRDLECSGSKTAIPDPDAQSNRSMSAQERGSEFPVHEFWLGRDGVIVENLVGLHRLPDEVELSLLPLAIRGGDGAPIRAIAQIT